MRLAEVFVEVADTRDDEFDLAAFLQLVTARAAEIAPSDAAGLLLADAHGRLQFVAGSDEATAMLELFQLQHHEGPCLECFHSGVPVANANLAEATDRWPRFAPAALAAGFQSVHAIPLRRPDSDTVGAVSLMDTQPGRLASDDIQIMQSLGAVVTIRLLQERAIHGAHVLNDQLQTALTSRIAIEQAKGVISQVLGVTVDQAFELMRAHARRQHIRLGELAQTLVNDPGAVSGLTSG